MVVWDVVPSLTSLWAHDPIVITEYREWDRDKRQSPPTAAVRRRAMLKFARTLLEDAEKARCATRASMRELEPGADGGAARLGLASTYAYRLGHRIDDDNDDGFRILSSSTLPSSVPVGDGERSKRSRLSTPVHGRLGSIRLRRRRGHFGREISAPRGGGISHGKAENLIDPRR